MFRIQPALPVGAMQTYDLSAPVVTHRRKASCQEIECAAWANGWTTNVDVATPLGAQQANHIRLHSKRSFTVQELGMTTLYRNVESVDEHDQVVIIAVGTEYGDLVTFTFYPGQECFAQHTLPLYRPPILTVYGGDWRGNPTGMHRTHTRAEDWIDDMQTTLGHVAEAQEHG
jgi:hypothetical protein